MTTPPEIYAQLLRDRPIYARLPGANRVFADLTGQDILDSAYLVEFWERRYIEWMEALDLLRDAHVNLNLLSGEQLDVMAPFFGWSSEYWSFSWQRSRKLALLSNTFDGVRIWDNKGSAKVINFLLGVFETGAIIRQPGGFVVNVSIVGQDVIGSDSPWVYEIAVPAGISQETRMEVEWVRDLFVPRWVTINIVEV